MRKVGGPVPPLVGERREGSLSLTLGRGMVNKKGALWPENPEVIHRVGKGTGRGDVKLMGKPRLMVGKKFFNGLYHLHSRVTIVKCLLSVGKGTLFTSPLKNLICETAGYGGDLLLRSGWEVVEQNIEHFRQDARHRPRESQGGSRKDQGRERPPLGQCTMRFSFPSWTKEGP